MGDYTTSGAPLGVGYDSNGDAKALVELNSITGLSGVSATTISATNYLGIPGGNLPTGNVGDIIYVQGAPDTYVSISPTASPLNLATTGYVAGELIPYETTANAAATYLTQSNAAATYLTQTNAAATYAQTGAGSFLNATATNLVVTNLTATNYQGPGGGGGSLPTGSTGQIVYYAAGGTTVTPLSPTATPLNLATTGYVSDELTSELANYATTADLGNPAQLYLKNVYTGQNQYGTTAAGVVFTGVSIDPDGSFFAGQLLGSHFVHDTEATGVGLQDAFLFKKNANDAFVSIDPVAETVNIGISDQTNIAGGDVTAVNLVVTNLTATNYHNAPGIADPGGNNGDVLYYDGANWTNQNPTATPLYLATTGYVGDELQAYVNYDATTTLLEPYFQTTAIAVYPTKSEVTGPGGYLEPYTTQSQVTGPGGYLEPYATQSQVTGPGGYLQPYATQSQVTGPGGYLEPYATTALYTTTALLSNTSSNLLEKPSTGSNSDLILYNNSNQTTTTTQAQFISDNSLVDTTQLNAYALTGAGNFLNLTSVSISVDTISATTYRNISTGGGEIPTGLQGQMLYYPANGTDVDPLSPTASPLNLATTGYVDTQLADYVNYNATTTLLDPYATQSQVTGPGGYLEPYATTAFTEDTYLTTATAEADYARLAQANTFTQVNSFEGGLNATGPTVFTGTASFTEKPTVNGTEITVATDLTNYAQTTALDSYLLTSVADSIYATTASLSDYAQVTSLDLYLLTSVADSTYATIASLNDYALVTALQSYLLTSVAESTYATKNELGAYAATGSTNTFQAINSFEAGFNATGPLVFTGTASFTEKPTVNGTEITVATDLTDYAQATALDSYLLTSVAESTYATTAAYLLTSVADSTYATTASLDAYALTASPNTFTALNSFEAGLSVTGIASFDRLPQVTGDNIATQNYVQTELVDYAQATALDSYLLTSVADSTYATIASLDAYALTASPNTFTALNSFEGGFNVTGPTTFTGTSEFKTLPTVNGGNVATESYVQTELADYAQVTSLDLYLLTSVADSIYATTASLDSYLLTSVADSIYATTASLDSYLLTSVADSTYATTAAYLLTSVADSTYATTGGGNTFEGIQVFKSLPSNSVVTTDEVSALTFSSASNIISGATIDDFSNVGRPITIGSVEVPFPIEDGSMLIYNNVAIKPEERGWVYLSLNEIVQLFFGVEPPGWPNAGTDYIAPVLKWDHGVNTSGLEDDDHTQYVLSDGTRPITYLSATEGISGAIVSATDVSTVNLNGTPIDMSFTDSGQILKYDGTTLQADYSDQNFIRVYNDTGIDISKGTAVYVSGALNANVFKVAPAKADAASSMPAIGLVYEDILNGGEGQAVSFGKAGGLNTASYAVGDTVYVSPTTAGGLTNIKPSGVDEFIQNVGIVSFVNAITGVIKVTGVGRANDVPNKVDAVSGNFDDLCINRVGQGRPTKFRWENDYLTPGATQAGWGSHTNNGTAGAGAGIGGHFSDMIDTVDYGVGVLEIRSGTGTSGRAMITTFNNVFVPSSMGFNLSHRLTMQDLYSSGTNEGYVIVGIADNGGNATKPTRGLYFRYDHTSTDWQAIATTAFSTETVSGTGVAVKEEEFQVLQIIVDEDWTKAQYFVDGSLVATMTLADGHEIPQTGQMGLQVKVVNTNGGAGNDIWLDWHVYELSVDKVDRGEDYIKAGFV